MNVGTLSVKLNELDSGQISFHFTKHVNKKSSIYNCMQWYTYRVLQTIQMKLILLGVWAEWAVMGVVNTALKLKYEIWID